MNKNKKILTLEDLENFYSKYKRSTTFSSKKSGYQLAVQIPTTFEIDEEYEDDTLLFCKSRMFHIGKNRNKSNVTEDAAKKAMKTMAYKPLLANFAEFEDEQGNKFVDFTSHDMIVENNSIKYLEHQIGCVTADEPWFEEYEGKTYVCGYLAIPRDYTEAVSVIERKNGTKVSVELLINELTYDAKEKTMLLTDVIVSGLTCLGRNPETGEEVQEGMINSRLDIKDFSRNNNSIIDFSDEEHSKLIETLERLNTTLSTLSNFNIDGTQNFSNNEKEGGSESVTKLEELLSKYNKTVDELDFETEGLSDEELEVKFTEVFDDNSEGEGAEGTEGADNGEGSGGEGADNTIVNNEENLVSEGNGDPESDPVEPTGEFSENPVNENPESPKFSKTFELSMEDIRSALYQLLEPVEQANNDWYWIVQTYDNRFIYQGCMGDYYCQKYTKDGNNIAFDGERYELFNMFLTASEKAQLESMRSNYSSIEAELNKYKEAEAYADKMTVFNDESYSNYLETDEFKELMSEETVKKFTKEELQEKADAALGKLVKKNKTFAFSAEKKDEKKKSPSFFAFAKQETDSSFLDSLLKK